MPIKDYTSTTSHRLFVALLISAILHLAALARFDKLPHNNLGNKDILLVSILAPAPENPHTIPLPAEADESTVQATSFAPTILPTETHRAFQDTSNIAPIPIDTRPPPPQHSADTPFHSTGAEESAITPPMPQPPASWVEIEYEVVSDSAQQPFSGRTTQRYETDSLGRYRLQSSKNTSESIWVLENEGVVTEEGLRPLSTQVTGNSRPDFSSRLFYQFMFSPPGGPDNRLWGIDGMRLSGHTYRILGMETLEVLTRGELRTVHLWLDPESPYPRKEVWLAVDYRYLPIRIRITDAAGKTSEQTARSFSLE